MFLLLITGLTTTFLIYNRKSIKHKIDQFQDLYKAENQLEKNKITCLKKTFQTLFKLYWFQILNAIDNPIQHIDNKHIVLTYYFRDRLYKILIRAPKGPEIFSKITNENGTDVSDTIKSYFGPGCDWHQRKYKPSFWGYKQLNFQYSNSGHIETFENDDIISLTLF